MSDSVKEIWKQIAMDFGPLRAYSFMIFNLLCAPCFAAIGAIKREMNNAKWTWFAIGYQCGFAYIVAFVINQIGSLFTGSVGIVNIIGAVIAFAVLGIGIYLLVKPYKEATRLEEKLPA